MDSRMQRVLNIFNNIADLLEISGVESYKAHAYRRAARNLAEDNQALSGEWDESSLQQITGIGPSLAEKAAQITRTGSCDYYDRLTEKVPLSVLRLLEVPGMGPKTAAAVYQNLGVNDLFQLQKAAEKGALREIDGIGAERERQILGEIKRNESRCPFVTLDIADAYSEHLCKIVKKLAGVKRVAAVGQLRRRSERVYNLELVVVVTLGNGVENTLSRVEESLQGSPLVENVAGDEISQQVRKLSFFLPENIDGILYAVSSRIEGATRLWFTGNKNHIDYLRESCFESEEMSLPEWLNKFKEKEEQGIYESLGLRSIPPELRLGQGEVESAAEGNLPCLISRNDLKGDLHCHTNWSDGSANIKEMVRAAQCHNLQYIAITDHSRSLSVAGGLGIEELNRQIERIENIRKNLKDFQLFSGIEVEVLSDGSLDLPEEVLRSLDVVIASVHSGLSADAEQLTKRLKAAALNPHVNIIAHPTGRLIGKRRPQLPDLDQLLKVCLQSGTAVEINSSPDRLDLPYNWVRKAKDMGVKLVINSDAHSTADFDLLSYGVDCARRGWCETEDIINTNDSNSIMRQLRTKKGKGKQ